MKQTFYSFHKQNIARDWQQENTFVQAFCSVPSCQTCMCKLGHYFVSNKLHWSKCYLYQRFTSAYVIYASGSPQPIAGSL